MMGACRYNKGELVRWAGNLFILLPGNFWADIYNINRFAIPDGPGKMQPQDFVALLAMPCAEQGSLRIVRMPKRQLITEVDFLLIR